MLSREGTLRADDVPPGNYMLTVQASEPRWARLAHEFTVTATQPGKDEGPLELGDLELLPRFWPKPTATKPADKK